MKKILTIIGVICLGLSSVLAQTVQVSGTVTSAEDGHPLPGVSVVVKGTTQGTVTNNDGKYSFTVPADATLQFSFLGMATQEIAVANRQIVDAEMVSSTQEIDEVVVVAYGTAKRTSFTGSVSTVKTEQLKDVPTTSFEQLLQGTTPGLTINSSTGQSGAVQNIRIRGIGSMNASNSPLYVLDGIPIESGNISVSGVDGNPGSLGFSNEINPNDIENITVLKDAAAAALYGSRGANGVILITTKRGKQGKTKVTLKADWGFNDWAVENRPYVNGDQMRELFTEGYYNALVDAYGNQYPDEEYWEIAREEVEDAAPIPASGYSDWEGALFNKRGTVQNYEVSLSGGTDKIRVFASLAYRDEEGKTVYTGLEQYNGRVNLNYDANDKFKLGANLAFARFTQKYSPEGTAYANPYYATRSYLLPTIPIYNPDGSYYEGPFLSNYGYANLVKDGGLDLYQNEVTSSSNSIWASYSFIEGLQFKQTLSYDFRMNSATVNWPSNSNNGENLEGLTIKITPTYSSLYSSSILMYDKTFGGMHTLGVMAGWDVDSKRVNSMQAVGQNFGSPDLIELATAATPLTAYSNYTEDRLLSFLSRINYDYDNKYYISGTYRRDGSTRLGANTRWGNFWSVSGAWRIQREEFLSHVDFLNDLKIRASYGASGTLPDDLYEHLATYQFTGKYIGRPASFPARIANPDLSWEKNYILDIGVEARFFDALSVEIDWYNRKTKDLLMDVPVTQTSGFKTMLQNVGEMNNRGIEVNISYDVFKDSDLKWTTGLALAHNKNKIVKLLGGKDIIDAANYSIKREGEAYYSLYTREFAGINNETGAEQWYTNKKLDDGTIEREITENATQANRTIVGKVDPDLTGGWRNFLSWKGIELSAMISFSIGGNFMDDGWYSTSNGYFDFTDLPAASQYDRWQKPGDDTDVGKRIYGYQYGNYASSKWMYSHTHARLKNVTLAYNLPKNITQKVKMENARVFISGINLLTWSKDKGFDPEVPENGIVGYAFPMLKTVTMGVEISF